MSITENALIDIPASVYHAHKESISKSGLDLISRSPAHYRYAEPREETQAMRIGTATHTAILEPERFRREYRVITAAKDRRCKAWNDAAKELDTGSDGDPLMLTGPEGERVARMAQAVRSTPGIAELLQADGRSEQSVFTRDPATGLLVRIRLDWITSSARAMDLKTTTDLRNDKLFRSVVDYRYHVQQAFYSDAFLWAFGERLDFAFGVIESEAPHVSKLVRLPDDVVAWGRLQYRRDLDTYARCLDRNEWPGPEPEIKTLITPQWALHRMEDDMGDLDIQIGEEV